jgi:hypothetical protein
MTISSDDYKNDQVKIIPGADPSVSSEQQRLAKAQGLMELFSVVPNKQEILRRILEAQDQQGIDVLMQQPQPQGPTPEEVANQIDQAKLQVEQYKAQSKAVWENAQAELFQAQARLATMQSQIGAVQAQATIELNDKKLQLEAAQAMHDALAAQQDKQIDTDQFNTEQATKMQVAQLAAQARQNQGATQEAIRNNQGV